MIGRKKPDPPPDVHADRWRLVRDLLVFQVKLVLDGLRDVLLSPISILAAIGGLLGGGDRPGVFFYPLLRVGRESDGWIGLFSAAEREGGETEPAAASVDAVVARIEDLVSAEVERGGMTTAAKEGVDRFLDRVQRGPGHGD